MDIRHFVLVLYSHDLKVIIRPGVTDHIRSKILAGSQCCLEADQWGSHTALNVAAADYDDGQLTDESSGIGIDHIELVGSGSSLFVGRYTLEANVAEDCFAAEDQQIKIRTAIRHIGKAIATGVAREVAAARINYPNQLQVTDCTVSQDHGDFFTGHKWEGLLQQYRTHTGGAADGNGMESISYPVVTGNGTKLGVNNIIIIINGDINGECIGGSIQKPNLAIILRRQGWGNRKASFSGTRCS